MCYLVQETEWGYELVWACYSDNKDFYFYVNFHASTSFSSKDTSSHFTHSPYIQYLPTAHFPPFQILFLFPKGYEFVHSNTVHIDVIYSRFMSALTAQAWAMEIQV